VRSTPDAEVAWQPGLTERPATGAWVVALAGDGLLVEAGMVGYIAGAFRDGAPIVRWSGDHQCVYPLKDLQRINKPRQLKHTFADPGQSWNSHQGAHDAPPRREWVWLIGEAS
jgi:hypothetical protein